MVDSMKKRIVILGGGFGGVYTAMYLENLCKHRKDYEISLVNKENYFVYQPMLAEVVGGSLGFLDTVSPLRRLIPKTKLYVREIDSIDLEGRVVSLLPKFSHTALDLPYDHLVFALGNVTDFRGAKGLHEHALPFKNLSDALRIRNHLIEVLENASIEHRAEEREKLLTVVVGGGGFSGTEIVAEVNDFLRNLAKHHHEIHPDEIKVYLVHSKDRLMERELSPSLSHYAEKILKKRKVEILFNTRLVTASPEEAILNNGVKIPSKTIISTVPSSPNPIIETLSLPLEKERIKTDRTLQVEGTTDLWALGDCAFIPLEEGPCPPTAQFAIREAKTLASNIFAALEGQPKKEFSFKGLGMFGALGHRSAVAELFGTIKISGFFAWLLWRLVYWIKLPGFDRKIKTTFSWLLDMVFPIEAVQLKLDERQAIAELHYEPGEVIFNEGDIGDFLYIIIKGKVEISRKKDGEKRVIAYLGEGEIFGEKALLNQIERSATATCAEACDLLAMRKGDFGALITNLKEFKDKVEKLEKERIDILK